MQCHDKWRQAHRELSFGRRQSLLPLQNFQYEIQFVFSFCTTQFFFPRFASQSKAISTDKALNIQLTVSLFEKRSEERKIELCRMKTRTVFHIENFEEAIKIDADQMTIPDVLAATCHGIAFSAARGMLVMSLQNTVISNAVLPIINPQVFLPPR